MPTLEASCSAASSCARSSPSRASTVVSVMRSASDRAGHLGQVQDPLGDDVVLDLVAAAVDRAGLAAEPAAHGGEFLRGEAIALPAQAVAAQELDGEFGAVLHH